MRHGILIALGAAAIAAVAAGCFGGAATTSPRAHRRATHVMITYHADGHRSLIHRTLSCRPPGGDYRDPAAACAALRDLERALLVPPRARDCGCIVEVHRPGSAVGELDGHPVVLPLIAGDLRVDRDVRVLTSMP